MSAVHFLCLCCCSGDTDEFDESMARRLSVLLLGIWAGVSLLLDCLLFFPGDYASLTSPEFECRNVFRLWNTLLCHERRREKGWQPLISGQPTPAGEHMLDSPVLSSKRTVSVAETTTSTSVLSPSDMLKVANAPQGLVRNGMDGADRLAVRRLVSMHRRMLKRREQYLQTILEMIKKPANKRRRLSGAYNSIKVFRHPLSVYLLAAMEPSYSCQVEERFGKLGDGGKVLCNPSALLQGPECLVYSYGSRLDCSFELDIKEQYPNCTIHVFDPRPSVVTQYKASRCSAKTIFHPFGLGGYETEKEIENSTVTLKPFLQSRSSLGDGNRTVQILKLDVEGSEFDAIQEMVDSNALANVAILSLEVHVHALAGTQAEKAEQFIQLFKNLDKQGFILYHKELNWIYGQGNAEFSFVHRNVIPVPAQALNIDI